MSGKQHTVNLTQVGPAAFEARATAGGSLIVDGGPDVGGDGRGMRPTELLLSALASCSAVDVVHILRKQREPLERLDVSIEGLRADAVPAPFVRVELLFTAHGAVDAHKLERAVSLAVEKYCSVRASLDPAIELHWSTRILPAAADPR